MDIKFCVFIAVSLDGYIARPNGKLDWLENSAIRDDSEDYGYQNFIRSIDCIVMGRKTFEKVASFTEWPYIGKRVIVLSQSLKKIPEDFVDKADIYGGDIELLAVELQHQRVKKVYVDGGLIIQSFLKFGLIDELMMTQVPILIGRGIPLFGDLRDDISLRLIHSTSFSSGFVQSQYKVNRRTKS